MRRKKDGMPRKKEGKEGRLKGRGIDAREGEGGGTIVRNSTRPTKTGSEREEEGAGYDVCGRAR